VTGTAARQRAAQSRRFDTIDDQLLLQASVGVLQDLGYGIEESRSDLGMVVGSKATPNPIRVQIVVRPAPDQRSSIARVTFQFRHDTHGGFRQDGMVDDALLYQRFFDRLAQSVFLTAHDV
jgi:hypothetical protein